MAKKIIKVATNRPKTKAKPKPKRPEFITSAAKAGKQARQALEFDLSRRLKDSERILSADDLSGLYDPKRQLFTTVDGFPRVITFQDLQNFRAAVEDLKGRARSKKFLGGIKPQQVVDLSWAEDRARAKDEITMAVPVSHRAGVIHFQTNSGPKSKTIRHHVYVELLNYQAAIASPADPAKIAKELLTGNVRFDCDCERHTFWFRYMASIGGYAYGRQETGFPKIRNPKLRGVACKHVLKVMSMLVQSPNIRQYGAKMIAQARETLDNRKETLKVKDMEDLAKSLKKESWRQRQVVSTEEKRAKRNTPEALARQKQREIEKAAKKEKARMERDRNAAIKAIELNAKKLLELGVINQQQVDAMLAAASNGS